jgi:hypothetical protein
MRTAADTPDQRLHEYERLFARALRRRERRPGAVVFAFDDEPEIRAWVDDLAHREAACCPFVDYRIEATGDELVWTMSSAVGGEAGEQIAIALDAIHDLAGPGMSTLFEEMAERGVAVIERGAQRFEMRGRPALK